MRALVGAVSTHRQAWIVLTGWYSCPLGPLDVESVGRVYSVEGTIVAPGTTHATMARVVASSLLGYAVISAAM